MIGFWCDRSSESDRTSLRCMSPETMKRIRSAVRATSRARISRTSPPTSSIPGVSTRTRRAESSPEDPLAPCSQRWAERVIVVPCVAPTSKMSRPSRALRTEDLPRLTMPNAAISMVVSSSSLVSSRSWPISLARTFSSSGVSFKPARVASRLSRARSTASPSAPGLPFPSVRWSSRSSTGSRVLRGSSCTRASLAGGSVGGVMSGEPQLPRFADRMTASPVPLPGGCSRARTRARVELLENPVHELTGEVLEELGSAGLLELAKQGLVDSSWAPRLTVAEVIDEGLARDAGEVGHGHGLNGSAGREAHERSFEHPGDERCGRFDEPELEHRLHHLARQVANLARRQLHALHPGQLGDQLELYSASGQDVERGNRVGEDRCRGDPLVMFDDLQRPAVSLPGKLLLGFLLKDPAPHEEVGRVQ